MVIRKRQIRSWFWITQIVISLVILFIFVLLGNVYVLVLGGIFLGLTVFVFNGYTNKISLDETAITETTLFGSRAMEWKEVQQIGLVVFVNKKSFLLKESLIALYSGHKEIYIVNYFTRDTPEFTDGGKRIMLDYTPEVWNLFKKHTLLEKALKQGEFCASTTKVPIF